MNDQIDNTLEQADEEILSYTVSDEVLENAAGAERRHENRTVTPFSLTICC
ncbi:MAG TPA: hypothetical protein VHV26_02565 [Rhizomicrobium sp.]|jgi:hypothetical protein|nr:hypothetical protein [Rhizomicrobium sp.]